MLPRPEQQIILDAQDRIRIVQAAPGSGKTWLVAEAIRRALDEWEGRHRGIAALSFTNVAGEEIRKTLCKDLSHPHFVGTLDSFLFRYVVKPFANLRDPDMPQPVLIPGEQASRLTTEQPWLREGLEVNLGTPQRPQMVNIFNINFTGGTRQAPVFVTTINWSRYELSRAEANMTIRKKRDVWRSSGRVSHSDAAYMAFQILSDPDIGQDVVSLIVKRFPVIFLDEVQDTGWFLGRAILTLLKNDQCRALVVGDPDQAIFEFNGASPRIFLDISGLDGATSFDIQTTLRCSEGVCTVARKLSTEDRPLLTIQEAAGRAILAIHNGEQNLPRELLNLFIQANPEKTHKLVARSNAIVNKLNGGPISEYPKFKSKPIANLHDGVNAMRRGNMRRAYTLAEAALGWCLFGTESPSNDDLILLNTDLFQWRKFVVQILLEVDRGVDGETLYEWGDRVRATITSTLQDLGWWAMSPLPRSPRRPNKANTENEFRDNWVVTPETEHRASKGRATTVHSVKGETHDSTIFYVPKASNHNFCPSEAWWSHHEQFAEERRIAYVAATRPRDVFVLCLHRDTLENFRNNRADFLEGFEHIELTDLISEYSVSVEVDA